MSEETEAAFGDPEHPNRPYPWPAPPEPSTPSKAGARIDLAQPRIVVIRQGAHAYTFNFPPIADSAWFKYFDGIVSTAERDGKEIRQSIDTTSAGAELARTAASSVEGYQLGTAIPLAHFLGVANVLTSAFVPDEDLRGFGEIPLHATWSVGESGAMRRHKNLVHIFDEPSFEQNRRYRRDDSRSHIVGGSRKGMTVYHGAQRTLAALYDELIVRVEGYVLNGAPLEGREAIARHMDTYHKVAAVARLFTPQEIETEEEDAE